MGKSLMCCRESDNQLTTEGGWKDDGIEITVRACSSNDQAIKLHQEVYWR